MKKVVFVPFNAEEAVALGVTSDCRNTLGIVANTMLGKRLRKAEFVDDKAVKGEIVTDYRWDAVGVLGGWRFSAVLFTGQEPDIETIAIDFLIVPIKKVGAGKRLPSIEKLTAMVLTDPEVN